MSNEIPFRWYTPFAFLLALTTLMSVGIVIGPTTLLVAWLVRKGASRAPRWDPDRYWDAIRGCAVVGSVVYAYLVARTILFAGPSLDLDLAHIVQRALSTGFDLSSPAAMLTRFAAGLLLTGLVALLLERNQPTTLRDPIRILTEAEKRLVQERQAERKRQAEAEQQREAAAQEAERKRQVALQEAAARRAGPVASKQTTASTAPASTPVPRTQETESPPQPGNLSAEEQARKQFLTDQAAALSKKQPPPSTSRPSPAPRQKRAKQDKGDGSMDDLL